MTDDELTEIEQRALLATKGPWSIKADGHFAAHARTDIPRLVTEVRQCTEAVEQRGETIMMMRAANEALQVQVEAQARHVDRLQRGETIESDYITKNEGFLLAQVEALKAAWEHDDQCAASAWRNINGVCECDRDAEIAAALEGVTE